MRFWVGNTSDMAGKVEDAGNQRVIDRIKCIAFREMKNAGADFITKEWIEKTSKEETLLPRNGGRIPKEDVFKSYTGRTVSLSLESREIINSS